MKLKVIFTLDPTGSGKDITEVIEIPSQTCLYCNCDRNINRFYDEINKSLRDKGYDFSDYNFPSLVLFKVYVL